MTKSKSLFTTKHYKAIAEIFNQLGDHYSLLEEKQILAFIIGYFSGEFMKDNPNFSLNKFVSACKLNYKKS